MDNNKNPRPQKGTDSQNSGRTPDNRASYFQERNSFQERRKKVDWVVRMASILSFVSWFVAFGVWIVLGQAQPEQENMFTRGLFNIRAITVRNYWDTRLLPIALGLLIASLCICIIAFLFNMTRMKRKTDKYRKSIIVIGIITIAGIVAFVIRFGKFLL